jgi:hypothetical protein
LELIGRASPAGKRRPTVTVQRPPVTGRAEVGPFAPPVDQASPGITGFVLAVASVLAIMSEAARTWPGDWLWDFGSFIESGRAAAAGLNPYGIYPLTFHVVLPGFEAWNPNLNPPVSALVFQLFDLAEPHQMFRIWYGVSFALYAVTVALLLIRYPEVPRLVLAVWAFALAGFWDTLLLGQIYVPLVLAGVGAWLLLDKGATIWAGVLIGVVVAIKPNFAVWPVLLFLSGTFRPAVVSFLTVAIVSLIPALVLGPEVYRQWLALLASDAERAFFLTNASLTGLAARVGVPALGWMLSLLLLAGTAVWAVSRRRPWAEVSAMALVVALLASPIAWVHYTLFLLPVFFSKWRLEGVRLVAALLIVPVPFVISQFGKSAWTQFTIGSVYNWALVLLLFVLLSDELRRSGMPRLPIIGFRRKAPATPG